MQEIIEAKLRVLNKPIKPSGQGFVMTTCLNPKHIDLTPSFSINLENGKGFCFSCGYSVGAKYWGVTETDVEALERAAKYKALTKDKKEEEGVSPTYLPPVDEALTNSYRGIPLEMLKELGCYISKTGKYANRIIFPVYVDTLLMGFDSRALGDEQPKYLRSKGFSDVNTIYPYNLVKKAKPNRVYIVEGIMDTLSGWVLGIPCICNFGVKPQMSVTRAKELLRLGVEEIVVLFDNDEAGHKTRGSLEKDCEQYFTVIPVAKDEFAKKFYASRYKDLNEMLEDLDVK